MHWLALTGRSAVLAFVGVAAQLGVAGTLTLTRWDARDDAAAWTALLTWVAFSFATAVALGAAAVRPVLRQAGASRGANLAAAVAAALGGVLAIPLAMLPARDARPPVPLDPELVVAMTAGAATVVGFIVGLVALTVAPVAIGLRVTAGWVWVAGIASAAAGLATGEPFPAPRLGVVDAASLFEPTTWTGPNLMIVLAGLVGIGVAATARRGGRTGAVIGGPAGPLVVAAAYLIAGPGIGTGAARAAQFGPYLASLLAVAAGLVTASIVGLPRRRRVDPPAPPVPATPAEPDPSPAPSVAPVPAAAPPPDPRPRPAWAGEYRVPYVPPPREGHRSQGSWQDWDTEERPLLGDVTVAHRTGRHALGD